MKNIRPVKKLGQNYLVDQNIINKFVAEIDIKPDDLILEIGPGKGAITKVLAAKTNNIIAIDIDSRIIDPLKEQLPNIEIQHKDILKTDIREISGNKALKVVGNIPFNLTSPILFQLAESREYLSDVVFIVQNEVAKRITAVKGTKEYGILSVILNYISQVDYCFKITRNVFNPRPNVDSAVIHMRFNKPLREEVDFNTFISVVKASFGNRRKTLKNSLSNSIFNTYDLSRISVDLSLRAEKLSVDDFVKLTLQIQNLAYE